METLEDTAVQLQLSTHSQFLLMRVSPQPYMAQLKRRLRS